MPIKFNPCNFEQHGPRDIHQSHKHPLHSVPSLEPTLLTLMEPSIRKVMPTFLLPQVSVALEDFEAPALSLEYCTCNGALDQHPDDFHPTSHCPTMPRSISSSLGTPWPLPPTQQREETECTWVTNMLTLSIPYCRALFKQDQEAEK